MTEKYQVFHETPNKSEINHENDTELCSMIGQGNS